MKQLLMAMLVGGSVLGASAGHQEVIHGTTYNVDTLESYYIGPAVEYTHYKFTTRQTNGTLLSTAQDPPK